MGKAVFIADGCEKWQEDGFLMEEGAGKLGLRLQDGRAGREIIVELNIY